MFTITYNKEKHSFESEISAYDFLKNLNEAKFKMEDLIACKINNEQKDLTFKINQDCTISEILYNEDEGQFIFKHSSAHVLGKAILEMYPEAKLSSGPPTEEGFYYDVLLGTSFSESDYQKLEKICKKILKKNFKFEKKIEKKENLLKFYENNEFKRFYVERSEEEDCSVYDLGGFKDFCRGPHVFSTGVIKAFKITHHGAAYFLGKAENPSLTRIYGISFPKKEMLESYLEFKKMAAERNHRKVGEQLKLFFFHEYSPGSCFFLPNGTFMYNKLIDFLKKEYKKRGFKEVITPNVFSTKLWEQSGHLQNYKENMFLIQKSSDDSDTEQALKPMNCPGHCIMFKNADKSYKELPLRIADFGALHRNEIAGALSGLTRVRRFQQDDAHIFCSKSSLKEEIESCLEFMQHVYKILGFEFDLFLSTRPEKYLGDVKDWDEAEDKLKEALERFGRDYKINEGDGAFYGPKIDVIVYDAYKRKHQCATIQLDFQLPDRFDLKFRNSTGEQERPVMIHRAILGSIERMFAIILENYGKNLPFWLTPRQIAVVPIKISEDFKDLLKFKFSNFQTKFFDGTETFNKRLRNAVVDAYSVVLIVGALEETENNVTVHGMDIKLNVDDFAASCRDAVENYSYNPFN